jgi:large subunit ribosomal protein L31
MTKQKIQYYPKAKIICACGNVITTGSTVPEMHVEICAKCHPFYTGKQKLIDTGGRIEKFKKRLAKKKEIEEKKKRK